jgi:hypothetical protein
LVLPSDNLGVRMADMLEYQALQTTTIGKVQRVRERGHRIGYHVDVSVSELNMHRSLWFQFLSAPLQPLLFFLPAHQMHGEIQYSVTISGSGVTGNEVKKTIRSPIVKRNIWLLAHKWGRTTMHHPINDAIAMANRELLREILAFAEESERR